MVQFVVGFGIVRSHAVAHFFPLLSPVGGTLTKGLPQMEDGEIGKVRYTSDGLKDKESCEVPVVALDGICKAYQIVNAVDDLLVEVEDALVHLLAELADRGWCCHGNCSGGRSRRDGIHDFNLLRRFFRLGRHRSVRLVVVGLFHLFHLGLVGGALGGHSEGHLHDAVEGRRGYRGGNDPASDFSPLDSCVLCRRRRFGGWRRSESRYAVAGGVRDDREERDEG
mmetsp:Transcript_9845/g.27569  ORF Transcript_9845/g.27569 Transcript_9845/m.27569 type:complete len:224 (+) Transcript_9845:632-1303(+)